MRIAEIFHSIQGEGMLAGTPSVFVRTTGCNLRCWFCDTPYTSWEPEGEHLSLDEILREVERCLAPGESPVANWRPGHCQHAVITGGEPMLQPQIVPLTRELAQRGMHVTIETAATVYRPVHCDLMSMSPKLSNSTPVNSDFGVRNSGPGLRGSGFGIQAAQFRTLVLNSESRIPKPDARHWAERHERLRINPPVIRQLIREYTYQVKFVIDTPADLAEVDEFLSRFPEVATAHVLLMPQGVTTEGLHERATWIIPHCEKRGFRYCPRLHIELFGNVRGT